MNTRNQNQNQKICVRCGMEGHSSHECTVPIYYENIGYYTTDRAETVHNLIMDDYGNSRTSDLCCGLWLESLYEKIAVEKEVKECKERYK